MIDSALQEIPSWWWFPDERPGDEWIPALADRPPSPPVQRIVKKVGRNEPCPCGSGKKYKKCCAQ
ncbi:MAG: SEC-C domain-containing protein [Bryobacterales bacterium]|nr:SEC-C domain-containing protein [Bryobacterales bacterium]